MANGAKFAQTGIDINRASDYELHFDSEWPTVHALINGTYSTVVQPTGRSLFFRHNLGYVPAFLPYVYDAADGSFEIFRVAMAADKENLYYYAPGVGGMGAGISTITYGVIIFNIDLEKNFVAPQVNPSTTVTGDQDTPFGIVVAKDGSNIKSKDMQDFLMNTNARPPLVHAVSSGLATVPNKLSTLYRDFVYTHDLPYNPMFLPYIQSNLFNPGEWVFIANFAGISQSGKTITLTALNPGDRGSIVILKDPFDVSDNTQVISV